MMMIEWTISLGSILAALVVCIGFIANGIATAVAVGRYMGAFKVQFENVSERLDRLEKSEERMTQVLVEMAQSRTEINLLSKRIDDIQTHGSYRLAEILASRFGHGGTLPLER